LNIFITGASGFVALNIIEEQLKRGGEITSFGPMPPPDQALETFAKLPGKHHFIQGDVTKPTDIKVAFDQAKPSHVIHGAALTIAGDLEAGKMVAGVCVNTLGAVYMMEASLAAGVERFACISSASVYGASSYGSGTLDEMETIPAPESLYAVTKYAAERLALRYRAQGLNVVIPRLSAVFGAWEYQSGVRDTLSGPHQAAVLALEGGDGVMPRRGPTDWVYSRDVAKAVLACLARTEAEPAIVNIGCGGNGWPVDDWCRKLKEHFPAFNYRIEEGIDNPSISYHGNMDRQHLNNHRLLEEVGYQTQYGLDEAFTDYIEWLESNKNLITN
jgi:nucleoside-diphosphate-sugar epimerase